MKILIISHMYPSIMKEIYGIFVHEQAIELIKHGCEIKVISPVPWTTFPINRMNAKWKAYSQIPSRAIIDGIEIHYPRYLAFPKMKFFALSGFWMYQGIKDLVNRIRHEFFFDLIHAHVVLPDGFAAMLINKRYHKPLIVTIHGQDIYMTIDKNQKCREYIYQVLKSARRVVVVSSILKRLITNNFFGLDNKIQIIPNGVPIVKFSKNMSGMMDKYKDKKIILSVGYLIERKAHAYVLEALPTIVKRHPNIIYLIVGNGVEEERLKNQAKHLNIEHYVEFLGQMSHLTAMYLMSICNVFVLPSWNEAFGVVYIEAMAHGKPVIACRGEGIEDVVTDGETGLLVKPKNVESLVEAIDFLLSNPDECKAMGERARELVLKNYTWQKNAKKTLEIYHELRGRL